MPQHSLRAGCAALLASDELRKAFGERSPATPRVIAAKAPDMYFQRYTMATTTERQAHMPQRGLRAGCAALLASDELRKAFGECSPATPRNVSQAGLLQHAKRKHRLIRRGSDGEVTLAL